MHHPHLHQKLQVEAQTWKDNFPSVLLAAEIITSAKVFGAGFILFHDTSF